MKSRMKGHHNRSGDLQSWEVKRSYKNFDGKGGTPLNETSIDYAHDTRLSAQRLAGRPSETAEPAKRAVVGLALPQAAIKVGRMNAGTPVSTEIGH